MVGASCVILALVAHECWSSSSFVNPLVGSLLEVRKRKKKCDVGISVTLASLSHNTPCCLFLLFLRRQHNSMHLIKN